MNHRQSVFPAKSPFESARYDNPRAVVRADRHEEVIYRIQRLQVKNGRLQFLTNGATPLLFAIK